MSAAIDIISVGMVTAVGLDAPSACAAMRARLDGFQETGFIGRGGAPQIGAPVLLPRNWIGEKRMAHLAAGAICEAFESRPEARGQTALILCLAEDNRPGRPIRDPLRLLRRIAEMVEVAPHSRSRVIAHGRPSGHVALEHTRKFLASDELPYVMIVGVDSYLSTDAISHYGGQSRLLSPDNPNGFIPGEAAAAVLCARGNKGGFRLRGLGLAREKAFIYNREDLPLRGDGLAEAYRIALKETGIDLGLIGYRISDLIGEQYWFKQNAFAAQRVQRVRNEFQDLWSPGESLGNVGAAVVPIMLGMAHTAARKGYAAGNPVLIDASNDSGACGAAVFLARAA
ncbi:MULTISPECIES: 3-oxoacyl-ACP synthase [unclassified Mesorhizobium]|uniref:3-oxoacyl-ACP synthase n=1 Tax=unclassified Mesorhizobium TaxID=325217 RepID=UPI000FCC4000|nr:MULTISPECIES: 3-oxoacyl-ACP synthase [unclassified Mesorhizobium]RUZ71868.1 3-oxoacyl-ACP synthase [Mesorhizobium sp. M7A.F.Ca.US.003.02.2.1]MBZ9887519.1 3-oxoacyl-ACP synthase [Mesorhizobium sp. BR1-1-3]RUY94544.1 3-oxoacyl-ACP synthase [Mesorhizobium sp. M7A.F.Ca.CA.001.12.2.1]RUZ18086.1 3-oxoacyl-ACP synthase [Mesorhizobium sp. M7A.F.Ca.US.007.01.2.1]RUZ40919.1 3-oxoacyl-ACP synthase [Mesorhizobium sp. M7A.F.Ca.US.003.02.1.1]